MSSNYTSPTNDWVNGTLRTCHPLLLLLLSMQNILQFHDFNEGDQR